MSPATTAAARKRTARLVAAGLFAGVYWLVVRHAWVTDDAFITFRTVKNFVAGHGLRYNLGERVQSYTSPLWLFLLSPAELAGVSLYYWAILLGLAFSGVLVLLLWRHACSTDEPLFPALVAVLLLATSDAFLTFQTSGLENSASHVLVVLFLMSAGRTRRARDLFVSALLGALALCSRVDHVWLLLPVAWYCFRANASSWPRKLGAASVGALPIVVWELFSVAYYGFLFPNTKYAKIGSRTPVETLYYGLRYVADYAQFEPLQLACILAVPLVLVVARFRRRDLLFYVGLGLAAEFLYVLATGGDFMRGRFFVRGLVVTVWAMIACWQAWGPGTASTSRERLAIVAVVVAFGAYSVSVVKARVPNEDHSTHNERLYYGPYLWLSLSEPHRYRDHPWARDAQRLDREHAGRAGAIVGVNGQRSYYIRPEIDLIDPVGLTDAFVARTPVTDNSRAGHFARAIPEEYLVERTSGTVVNGWKDPRLERLWRDIQRITQGTDLWSRKRLAAMKRVWREHGF